MLNKRWVLPFVALLLTGVASPTWAQTAITSGPNMGSPNNPHHLTVPWEGSFEEGHWLIDEQLIFDPDAPPMEKWFMTPPPQTPSGIPPGTAFPVWENFFLVPGASQSVLDWHEEIHTPGWEWRYWEYQSDPTDPNYQPLITRDGLPWPWKHQPPPATGGDPSKMIWVEFPAIEPGHVLDVHKALIWVGDGPNNQFWGDDATETMIAVWEYPTPEPSSFLLVVLGGLALAGVRRRRA